MPMQRRQFIQSLVGAGALLLSACRGSSSMLDIQRSDHFDGERFFNPWGSNNEKNLWDVIKWRVGGERCAWDNPRPGELDYPPERVNGEQLRLSFIGHATVLLQTAGVNILFDPQFSERASPVSFSGPRRVSPPGVNIEDLPPIDWVLISHNHYDHLDIASIGRLRQVQPQIRYIVPLNNAHIITDEFPDLSVAELDWQQSMSLGSKAELIVQPAQHWSARGIFDRNRSLWAAFVIRTAGGNIYFAGDTGFGSHFQATADLYAPFRLSILPIGAYAPRDFMSNQHMDPQDAVRSAQILRSRHNLGVHLRTFAGLTDECYDAPEQELNQALANTETELSFKVLNSGQSWWVPA